MGKRGPQRKPTEALVSWRRAARLKEEREAKRQAALRVESGKIVPCDIPDGYKMLHVKELASGSFQGGGFCKEGKRGLTKNQIAKIKRGWDVLQELTYQHVCLRTFKRRSPNPQLLRLLPWAWWFFESESHEKRNPDLPEIEQLAQMNKLGPVFEVYDSYCEMTADPDASMELLKCLFEQYI